MKQYAYVYSKKICNDRIAILSMQLTIAKYIQEYFDTIEISNVTIENIKKYEVVCIDGYAINDNFCEEKEVYDYMEIIKHGKNITILMRDLHEWTFIKNIEVVNDFFNLNKDCRHSKDIKFTVSKGYIKLKNMIDEYNIKNIVTIYKCEEFVHLINHIHCKPYILPLHVDTNIFKNFNKKRDIDILFYGADYGLVYPLRKKIKEAVKNSSINYHIVPPTPSYCGSHCNSGLADLLNRSWLTVCTCSIFNYLVLRYFEASACGSVIIGNMADQGMDLWKDNYINIPSNADQSLIISIITDALKDKKNLEKISNEMSKKITDNYNYTAYAVKLKNICDTITKTSSVTNTIAKTFSVTKTSTAAATSAVTKTSTFIVNDTITKTATVTETFPITDTITKIATVPVTSAVTKTCPVTDNKKN